jgi:hypothetical protein
MRKWVMAKITRTTAELNQPAGKKAAESKGSGTCVEPAVSATPTEEVITVSLESDYVVLVRRLDSEWGVKVGSVPATAPVNPYLASAAVMKKALQAAGILTRSGNLSPRYR